LPSGCSAPFQETGRLDFVATGPRERVLVEAR